MTDLTDTRVLVVESGDEHRRLARRVHLIVDRADFEHGCSARSDLYIDESCTVLNENTGAECGVDGEVDFGRARVGVGEIETAGAEVANCCTQSLSIWIFISVGK